MLFLSILPQYVPFPSLVHDAESVTEPKENAATSFAPSYDTELSAGHVVEDTRASRVMLTVMAPLVGFIAVIWPE